MRSLRQLGSEQLLAVVPWRRKAVAPNTIRSIRRSLQLTPEDGISDEESFGVE